MTSVRRSPFKALHHRNFRLLWIGQLVSMAGSMMQSAAILWHVSLLVEPGKRGLALGMVGLVRVVPIVTFSLIAGVIADAHDRRRLRDACPAPERVPSRTGGSTPHARGARPAEPSGKS